MIPASPAASASGTARAGLVRLGMPELASLREFFVFAGPGFFALLGKVISYSSMSYAAAAAGTVALAAHQIVVQVFFFFCNIGDAVSNTAQAFLPALWSRGDPRQTRQVIKTVVVVSFILGVLDAGLGMAIPRWLSHIFTGELNVQACMQHVVWHLGASLVLHANVVALEGVGPVAGSAEPPVRAPEALGEPESAVELILALIEEHVFGVADGPVGRSRLAQAREEESARDEGVQEGQLRVGHLGSQGAAPSTNGGPVMHATHPLRLVTRAAALRGYAPASHVPALHNNPTLMVAGESGLATVGVRPRDLEVLGRVRHDELQLELNGDADEDSDDAGLQLETNG